jgi:hypothetical protein
MTAAAAKNRLMSKVQRHDVYSVSKPPSTSPIAAPPPATAPKTPKALARSLGAVNMAASSDNAAGARSAPNAPCAARPATSIPKFTATPPITEDTAKPTRPMMNSRRRPRTSVRRPPSRSRAPKASA